MTKTAWARITDSVADVLRRGAWYPVLEETSDGDIVLDVQSRKIRLSRQDVHVRENPPERWSVVVRTGGDLQVFGLDPAKQARDIKRRIGVVPQENALDDGLTVLENMRIYASFSELTRQTADVTRFGRYRQAAADAVQFLSGLQYTEANTRHFENTFRANVLVGGFYLSPTDGNLRIDATAAGVGGMLQFLASGAER